jgi:hypothetical protein
MVEGIPLWASLIVLTVAVASIAYELVKIGNAAREDRTRIADELKRIRETAHEIAYIMEQTMHTPETRAKIAKFERSAREWRQSQEDTESK